MPNGENEEKEEPSFYQKIIMREAKEYSIRHGVSIEYALALVIQVFKRRKKEIFKILD